MTSARAKEAVAVLALAFGWIVLLYAAFNTLWQGDSGGYVAPGCMLWGPIGVRAYDGARTPLYPIFLSALQHVYTGKCVLEPGHGALDFISGVQLLLYLGSIVYLYRALADFGVVVRLVGMVAIAFSPLHALFARQILSEALAAPLALLFIAHLLRFVFRGRSERDATLTFVLFTLLTLTRPNVLVPLLPAAAVVVWLGADRRRLLVRALLATALPLFVATCLNYANRGYFKLTNFEGFSKTHVVYNVFDRVHEEDALLGSIMSTQHRLDVERGQADGQVVWRALPEILKALDRMPYKKRDHGSAGTSDLNAYLGKVSDYLIRENPGVVVDNARKTFLQLYEVGVLGIPPTGGDPRSPGHDGNIRSEPLNRLFLGAQPIYNGIARLSLVLVPLVLAVGLYLHGPRGVGLPLLFYAVYLCNMVMVSLFNVVQVRYLTLMQPFLLLALCMAVQTLIDGRTRLARSAGGAEEAEGQRGQATMPRT